MTEQEVEDRLYEIDRRVRMAGMQPMNGQELRGAATKLKQQQQTDIPISQLAEGGFVNDASGAHTARVRRQLGIR